MPLYPAPVGALTGCSQQRVTPGHCTRSKNGSFKSDESENCKTWPGAVERFRQKGNGLGKGGTGGPRHGGTRSIGNNQATPRCREQRRARPARVGGTQRPAGEGAGPLYPDMAPRGAEMVKWAPRQRDGSRGGTPHPRGGMAQTASCRHTPTYHARRAPRQGMAGGGGRTLPRPRTGRTWSAGGNGLPRCPLIGRPAGPYVLAPHTPGGRTPGRAGS